MITDLNPYLHIPSTLSRPFPSQFITSLPLLIHSSLFLPPTPNPQPIHPISFFQFSIELIPSPPIPLILISSIPPLRLFFNLTPFFSSPSQSISSIFFNSRYIASLPFTFLPISSIPPFPYFLIPIHSFPPPPLNPPLPSPSHT